MTHEDIASLARAAHGHPLKLTDLRQVCLCLRPASPSWHCFIHQFLSEKLSYSLTLLWMFPSRTFTVQSKVGQFSLVQAIETDLPITQQLHSAAGLITVKSAGG